MHSLATLISVAVSAAALPACSEAAQVNLGAVDQKNFLNLQSDGKISDVHFQQNAMVSAYLIVNWFTFCQHSSWQSKDLGHWLSQGQGATFNLQQEGIPEGSKVNFASYDSAVGKYPNDYGFEVVYSANTRANFKQTGTAFKGWFEYIGLQNNIVTVHANFVEHNLKVSVRSRSIPISSGRFFDPIRQNAALASVKVLQDALAVIA
ncbi:hypothetical protein C8R46DRAFT_1027426 [Mycena filopes]|nr:hypothetical protein C8R46DRAFT_1027426 [Mycena filopes]